MTMGCYGTDQPKLAGDPFSLWHAIAASPRLDRFSTIPSLAGCWEFALG
jgi:hypothetical protein